MIRWSKVEKKDEIKHIFEVCRLDKRKRWFRGVRRVKSGWGEEEMREREQK